MSIVYINLVLAECSVLLFKRPQCRVANRANGTSSVRLFFASPLNKISLTCKWIVNEDHKNCVFAWLLCQFVLQHSLCAVCANSCHFLFTDQLEFGFWSNCRFNEENIGSIQPYSYLPFGAGPRNCIGMRFALHVVKTCLFHVVHSVELVRTQSTQVSNAALHCP